MKREINWITDRRIGLRVLFLYVNLIWRASFCRETINMIYIYWVFISIISIVVFLRSLSMRVSPYYVAAFLNDFRNCLLRLFFVIFLTTSPQVAPVFFRCNNYSNIMFHKYRWLENTPVQLSRFIYSTEFRYIIYFV